MSEKVAYWKAITQLEAQEHLMRLREVNWPNAQSKDKSSHIKNISKLAWPEKSGKRKVTTAELAEILKSR